MTWDEYGALFSPRHNRWLVWQDRNYGFWIDSVATCDELSEKLRMDVGNCLTYSLTKEQKTFFVRLRSDLLKGIGPKIEVWK